MTILGTVKAGVRTARVAYGIRRLARVSGDEAKARARQQLFALLSRTGGVAAKLGQSMGMRGHGEEFERLGNEVEPLPIEAVRSQIEEQLGAQCDALFTRIESVGKGASFGQVHRAMTVDGRDVAIKVRYPGIESAVRDEFSLLKALPKPPAMRRVGFDLAGMQRSMEATLLAELDYREEAQRQIAYAETCSVERLVVPKVHLDLCRDGILTQSFECGVSLREVAATWSTRDRASVADTLVRHFLRRYFVDGPLHADPHTGNYLFRKSSDGTAEVVLLDYGSVVDDPLCERHALLRLLHATERREAIDPIQCFSLMGFDSAKLEPIAHLLPALAGVLFEPFVSDQPVAVREWQPGTRVRELLADLGWWFRAAAPAGFLLTLRAWAGLLAQLDTLNVRPRWRRALREECRDSLAAAECISLDMVSGPRPSCQGVARAMKVTVSESGRDKVSVTLPIRVMDDLASVMEPDVVRRLQQRGIDLDRIAAGMRAKGYPLGVVVDAQEGDKRYRVALV